MITGTRCCTVQNDVVRFFRKSFPLVTEKQKFYNTVVREHGKEMIDMARSIFHIDMNNAEKKEMPIQ